MGNSSDKPSRDPIHSPAKTNRRDFLKVSALGALAAVGSPAMARQLAGLDPHSPLRESGNSLPGRIVRCHDVEMSAHNPTIDRDRVEEMVHRSVHLLTEIYDTGAAFASLFPLVNASSTFAIKVNCIGSCCTRWEVARGVVSGLSQMLGGTYDVSQVTIFDRHNLHYYGYDEAEFTFNGNFPLISHINNASNSGHEPWPGYDLSRYILNCDYVINMPVLKCHSDPLNHITVALKNHYGSCSPSSLCGNIPGMLALNSDDMVKNKTGLVLTDALRATFTGGPGNPPQNWPLYPELTPNTFFASTDPVTNEYWARDLINAQRVDQGYAPKACPWIEQASANPYYLGVSDESQMTVLNLDPAQVAADPVDESGGTFLAPNSPNPFREGTTLSFRLARNASASLVIVDPAGRIIRRLASNEFPAGYSRLHWDGRNDRGSRVSSGVYFARLQMGEAVWSRSLTVLR